MIAAILICRICVRRGVFKEEKRIMYLQVVQLQMFGTIILP